MVFAMLAAGGHEARAVGGAVRNALLGMPVSDVDIATTARPEEVIRLASAAGMTVIPTGLAHGTVTVLADHVPHEVTTLREDVETDGRRATVAFTADWAADARRRDFTMNALYCTADGTVHDPLGGHADLVARRVRFIGDPARRLAEDYLRILRFFRLNAAYATPPYDAEGLSACVRARSGLARLSAERIRVELLKLLAAPGAIEAVMAMFDHGLLVDVLGCAPRLSRLSRTAILDRSSACAVDSVRRLAALSLHVGPEDALRLARRLRHSNADEERLVALAPGRRDISVEASASAQRRALYRIGPAQWRDAVASAWLDSGADWTARWQELIDLPVTWPVPELPVKGSDLLGLGLTAGPPLGATLRALETEWIASDFVLSREELLAKARTLGT
jgi:tRNA nucleotidyltransferase/poly(A) polymerase